MTPKSAPKRIAGQNPAGKAGTASSVPAAEALSFLKETRGMLAWNARHMAESLKIKTAEAERVVSVLAAQGYVKPHGAGEWLTTVAGETASGSKPPRFTAERVDEALSSLRSRISAFNHDASARYKITDAIAFGDFLTSRARVQAADVGIRLVRRGPAAHDLGPAQEHKAQWEILKQLRNKNIAVQIQPCERWMSARTHRSLL